MGKTFRKEKTISKQRQRLNTNKGTKRFHFEEYDFDPAADNKINGIKEPTDAKEIHPSQELHQQRPPQSSDKTDNG